MPKHIFENYFSDLRWSCFKNGISTSMDEMLDSLNSQDFIEIYFSEIWFSNSRIKNVIPSLYNYKRKISVRIPNTLLNLPKEAYSKGNIHNPRWKILRLDIWSNPPNTRAQIPKSARTNLRFIQIKKYSAYSNSSKTSHPGRALPCPWSCLCRRSYSKPYKRRVEWQATRSGWISSLIRRWHIARPRTSLKRWVQDCNPLSRR